MAERKVLKKQVLKTMLVSLVVNSILILAFLVLTFAQTEDVAGTGFDDGSWNDDEQTVEQPVISKDKGTAPVSRKGRDLVEGESAGKGKMEPERSAPGKEPDIIPVHLTGPGMNKVEGLIAGLADKNPEVRESSEKQLIKTGPEAVPALLNALDSPKKRDAVVRIFNQMGCKAVDTLLKLLKEDDTRTKAGSMLFQSTNPGCVKHIGAYLACMENAGWGNYCGAALVKTSGPKAKSWLPELKNRLTYRDAYSRAYVTAAIGEMGKKARTAVPELLGMLKDPAPIVRIAAVVALRKTGTNDRAVREAIDAAAAGDSDSEVRREAGESLKTLK